jgi:hypothetical protein
MIAKLHGCQMEWWKNRKRMAFYLAVLKKGSIFAVVEE